MIVFDKYGHLLYGIYVGVFIMLLLDLTIPEKFFYFISMTIGLLLPDIDIQYSTYGKRIRPLSKWLNKKVGHRTLTHSLFFITVLYFSSNIAFGMNVLTTGLMIGCVVHVFCDLFTPSGVPLAYPLSNKRYRLE